MPPTCALVLVIMAALLLAQTAVGKTRTVSNTMSTSSSQTHSYSSSTSSSFTQTQTTSQSASASTSSSFTTTQSTSQSASASTSSSFTITPSTSLTQSWSFSTTASQSFSASFSASQSNSMTFTTSTSASASKPPSRTRSLKVSQSTTGSSSVSHSDTASQSGSEIHSTSFTSSFQNSKSLSQSVTVTITPPPTPTATHISTYTPTADESRSASLSPSLTIGTPSLSNSTSVTASSSLSVSRGTPSSTSSLTPTLTVTPLISPTPTLEPTFTSSESVTISDTYTESLTFEITETESMTVTFTVSHTQTLTLTMRITDSQRPATTTAPPTVTPSFMTRCPSCGNGTCDPFPPFKCVCYLSFKLGYWQSLSDVGAVCDRCLALFWGPQCRNICPGGVCAPCNNHGTCDDGVSGSGNCTCHRNTTFGFWDGSACDQCLKDYYGPQCNQRCDCVRGVCNETVTGNGKCLCPTGYDGLRCEACATGYYNTNRSSTVFLSCSVCPGSMCNGHGVCDPDTGTCYCNAGTLYTPASYCKDIGTVVNGCTPPCLNNGTCTFGRCICTPYFRGPGCESPCPLVNSTICAGRGDCLFSTVANSSVCNCRFALSGGYYNNTSNCSLCEVGSGGPNCALQCPRSDKGICNAAVYGEDPAALCDNVTATCKCHSIGQVTYCGADCATTPCNACPAGEFGVPSCLKCFNGTVQPDNTTRGRCVCDPLAAGTQCELKCSCANMTALICPHRNASCVNLTSGYCPFANTTCVCNKGFGGAICSTMCPKSTANGTTVYCSGNGDCNEGNRGNGLCVCRSNYVGADCSVKCKCLNASLGTCGSDGICRCALNTFRTGDDCGRCLAGRSGNDCRTQCVNGTTNGTSCDCFPKFGGKSCSVRCPEVDGQLCNNKGNCSEGSNGTGQCTCIPGFVGPSCNCTQSGCLAQRPNSKCDVQSGVCVCALPFSGANCTTCAPGFWGSTCTDVCQCKHGFCDRKKGTCTCLSSDTDGHWTGAQCTTCQYGYNPPDCIQVASVTTQLAAMQSIISQGNIDYFSKDLIVFEAIDVAVALGPIVTVYLNISHASPSVLVRFLISSFPKACQYAYGFKGVATPLQRSNTTTTQPSNESLFIVTSCGGSENSSIFEFPVHPVSNFLSAEQRAIQTLTNRSFSFTIPQLVAAVAFLHFTHVVNGVPYIALAVTRNLNNDATTYNGFFSVDFNISDRALRRNRPVIALRSNLESVMTTMTAILYDAASTFRLYLVGSFAAAGTSATDSSTADRVGVLVYSYSPTVANDAPARAGHLPNYQVVAFACMLIPLRTAAVSGPYLRVYLMLQVFNSSVNPDFIRLQLWNNGTVQCVTSYTNRIALVAGDVVAAAVFDDLSGMLTAVANFGVSFKLIRLELESSSYIVLDGPGARVVGTQFLNSPKGADRRMVSARMSNFTRQLFLLQYNATGTIVRRFLMYENIGLFPPNVSRASGPVITVTGRGFVSAGTPSLPLNPQCRVWTKTSVSVIQYVTPATVVNSTTVLCRLDASNASLCVPDIIEVSLFETFFTSNQLYVTRYQIPRLTSVAPQTFPFSALGSISAFYVYGSGFVSVGIAKCSWSVREVTTQRVVAVTDGVVLNATSARCDPPAASLPKAMLVNVNVACDGFVFTSEYSAKSLVSIVGGPYNLTASESLITLKSQPTVTVPPIRISFVDESGASLGATLTDRIQVSVSLDGGLVATPSSQLAIVNNEGAFNFSMVQLVSPLVNGLLTQLVFRAVRLDGGVQDWVTRVPIAVLSGDPDQLVLAYPPSNSTGIPESNIIPQFICAVLDYAGNRVTLIGNTATAYLIPFVAPGVVLPPSQQIFSNESLIRQVIFLTSGTVAFQNVPVNATGGMLFYILVRTDVRRAIDGTLLSVRTDVLVPKCGAGKVRLLGESFCSLCPDFMSCPTEANDFGNASLYITVNYGYWRSSVYSKQAVPCTPVFACVGGAGTGACADGYAGPLCGQCGVEFGRSIIGGDCVACYSDKATITCFVLVLVGVALVFIFATIASVQNWPILFESVVVMKLLVSHLHAITGVGMTGFPFAQFFKDSISYLGVFSARVLDYFFSDCLLEKQGLTFYNKVTAFSLIPFVALLIASGCWLIVFLAPGFLKHEKAHDERQKALTARRDEILRKLAKRSRKTISTAQERERRIVETAQLNNVEAELKENLSSQGLMAPTDYRLLASHCLQVVMFFTFHSIVFYNLTVFDCQIVDTGLGSTVSYLRTDNRVSCNSPEYLQFSRLGTALTPIYFILVPGLFMALYRLHLHYRPTKSLQRKQLFYFFTMGTKTGSWFWPGIVMISRGLQFAIVASSPSPADSHMCVWVFVAQFILLFKIKPYVVYQNMYLEAFSLVCCICSASIAILFQSYTSSTAVAAMSGTILAMLLAPVPFYFYVASQKWWSSFRDELRQLRFDSESDSDDIALEEDVTMVMGKRGEVVLQSSRVADELKEKSLAQLAREDVMRDRKNEIEARKRLEWEQQSTSGNRAVAGTDVSLFQERIGRLEEPFLPQKEVIFGASVPSPAQGRAAGDGAEIKKFTATSAKESFTSEPPAAFGRSSSSSTSDGENSDDSSDTNDFRFDVRHGVRSADTTGLATASDRETARVADEIKSRDEVRRREDAFDDLMELEERYAL